MPLHCLIAKRFSRIRGFRFVDFSTATFLSIRGKKQTNSVKWHCVILNFHCSRQWQNLNSCSENISDNLKVIFYRISLHILKIIFRLKKWEHHLLNMDSFLVLPICLSLYSVRFLANMVPKLVPNYASILDLYYRYVHGTFDGIFHKLFCVKLLVLFEFLL